MRKPTEADTLRQCLELLKLRQVFSWRNQGGAVYDPARKCFRSFTGLKGVSDVIGVLPGGKFLGVECKAPRGKLSAEQEYFLQAVDRLGGVAVCVRDVLELAAFLDGMGL